MNKLKEDIFLVIDKINQNWVEEYKKSAKEKTEFDYPEVMGKFSKLSFDLNKAFLEYDQRNKKRGWF